MAESGSQAAVIRAFDLDGTLIDARPRQVAVAVSAWAEVTGEALDAGRFWRRKRAGASTELALRALGCAPRAAADAARLWSEQIEADEWLALDCALPGARGALTRLRGVGARIVVITARRRPAGARLSVRCAGLEALIDDLIVVSPSSAVPDKAAALRRSQANSFIGDTASDGEAARAAGVPFRAVMTGQRSRGHLTDAGFKPKQSITAAVRALSATAPLVRI